MVHVEEDRNTMYFMSDLPPDITVDELIQLFQILHYYERSLEGAE